MAGPGVRPLASDQRALLTTWPTWCRSSPTWHSPRRIRVPGLARRERLDASGGFRARDARPRVHGDLRLPRADGPARDPARGPGAHGLGAKAELDPRDRVRAADRARRGDQDGADAAPRAARLLRALAEGGGQARDRRRGPVRPRPACPSTWPSRPATSGYSTHRRAGPRRNQRAHRSRVRRRPANAPRSGDRGRPERFHRLAEQLQRADHDARAARRRRVPVPLPARPDRRAS